MKLARNAFVTTTALLLMSACTIAPEAVMPSDIASIVEADTQMLAQEIEAIQRPIGLDEAIARALKNNRDKKLKALEAALAQGQIDLVRYEMLPSLTASAGYSERNNFAASGSVTFSDGKPDPLGPDPTFSVSQERNRTTYDAVFAWNVLDFGLSYVRAKQHADRYLIAKERERKVVHNITQEVRAAYWRAVSASRLLQKIGPLSEKAAAALANSREVEARRLRAPLEALYYQRELLDVLRSLQALRQDLVNAKIELAGLMGLNPGADFELADAIDPAFDVPTLDVGIEKMEERALTQRPELVETHYQERISVAETRAALLKLLPSLNLNAGIYGDRNKFLLNEDWTTAGAQVSWNLFNLFRYVPERNVAEARQALAIEQRLATSMAVLTQVHLARARFDQSRETYDLAERYLSVASRIREQSQNTKDAKRTSELDLIRESLNTLLAELRRDVAYADLQNSYGKLFVTMGMDLVPEEYSVVSLSELTNRIGARFDEWAGRQSDLPENPEIADEFEWPILNLLAAASDAVGWDFATNEPDLSEWYVAASTAEHFDERNVEAELRPLATAHEAPLDEQEKL